MDGPPLPVGGPSWAAVAPDGALDAARVAARIGAYCWVEQQLFSLFGGWVVDIAEPDAKALVAEHAEHAGWRAQRWFELLPTAAPGADALVVAPSGMADALVRAADEGNGSERTVEKLAIAHRALGARLLAAYTAHLDWAPSVSEAAIRRTLAIAGADLAADGRHGERLLQALTVAPGDRARARLAAAAVDEAVASAGGVVGNGTVGDRSL